MSNQVQTRTDVKEDTTTSSSSATAHNENQTALGQIQIVKTELEDTTQRVVPLSIQKRKKGFVEQQGLFIGKTITRNILEGDILLSEPPLVMYLSSYHDVTNRLQKLSKTPVPFTLMLTYMALTKWKTMDAVEEAKRTYHWQTKQVLFRDETILPQVQVIDYIAKTFRCTKEQVIGLWNTIGAYHILLRGHHIQGMYGAALYRFSSMINHSCDPNAEWVFQPSGTITIQAVRTITSNAEISTSYIPAISIMERHQRQRQLFEDNLIADGRCVCQRCRDELLYDVSTSKKLVDGPSDWLNREKAADGDCEQILIVAGANKNKLRDIIKLNKNCITPLDLWRAHWRQFEFFKPYFEQYPVQLWTMMAALLYKMFFSFSCVISEDLGHKDKNDYVQVMEEFANFLEATVFPLFADKSLEDYNRTAIERHRRTCKLKPDLLDANVDFKNFPVNSDGVSIMCPCGERIDHYMVGLTNMSMTPILCRQYSHRHFMYLMFTILTVIGRRIGGKVETIDHHRVNGWVQTHNLFADDRTHAAYMQSNANLCTFTDTYPPIVPSPSMK